MKRPPQNVAHSIRERLFNLAKARNEEFQNFLMRYALERWLYRLSLTEHRDRFVLKGAMLFALWNDEPHRPTQDLDLLGIGSSSIGDLESVFREICEVRADEDGLSFQADSVSGRAIREQNIYDGVRLVLKAALGKAVIPLQIDVGFGDAITPPPEMIEYPVTLDLPAPRLRAYRRETVIAEKFNAMVELGMRNTRLKDFYDLWALASGSDFEGEDLSAAIRATFARRRTPLPSEPPVALTAEFSGAALKQSQWRAFVRRGKLRAGAASLNEVTTLLREFLTPVVDSLNAGSQFSQRWKAGGPWSD
jgi:predicted nucleotidyltransferase component of viral defense system